MGARSSLHVAHLVTRIDRDYRGRELYSGEGHKMTTINLAHKHFDEKHLAEVIAEMKVLGSPTIKAVDIGDCIQALEGCHRIRAAKELGMPIKLEMIAYDDPRLICEVSDIDDNYHTIGDWCDFAYAKSEMIEIDIID